MRPTAAIDQQKDTDAKCRAGETQSRRRRRSECEGAAQPLDGGSAAWLSEQYPITKPPTVIARGRSDEAIQTKGCRGRFVWIASSLTLPRDDGAGAWRGQRMPSPCSPSRQITGCAGASRALTAPRADGYSGGSGLLLSDAAVGRYRRAKGHGCLFAAPTRCCHAAWATKSFHRRCSATRGAAQPLDGGSAAWPARGS